ncbi:MAG TPA: lipid-transfer protein, partial [Acidimicrobiales bacterium]|nr:lipid-transfer protein [Acidimicrobiales bacterium]
AGQPFSFVQAVDAIGAFPPIVESHVEMDGAWALYEAWVKLQMGEIDSALVFGYGKSSSGELRRIMTLQLDPFYVAPLWPDSISIAALQARLLLESTSHSEADLAEVVSRNRRKAMSNPDAQLKSDRTVEQLLAEPMLANPLRLHDCPPVSDGAAAVVLAAGDLARKVCSRPAWIRGIDHRIEAHGLGVRDLTVSPSTSLAAAGAGVADGKVDVAEVHAPFSHQELILTEALGLGSDVELNPSGGALGANPMMAAGLIRFGEAARRIWDRTADRAVAHATSGPCLQQNMVCVLEGE